MHTTKTHGGDRDTHISRTHIKDMEIFQTTPKGEAPDKIAGFAPQLVMTSNFLRSGIINTVTITYDLSAYSNKRALQKALASCIQAQTACGYARAYPALAEWEIKSPRCNPEYASEKDFAAWHDSLPDKDKAIVDKLERFIHLIITANFKANTYHFNTDITTRARRPATA